MVDLADFPSYKKFNDAANNIFFDGRFSNEPIYLDLEGDVLEQLSQQVSVPVSEVEDELSKSVISTLDWTHEDIYAWHSSNAESWRASDFSSPPPFTALLLVLSLAAERMRSDGEYSANNYYARLAEIFLLESASKNSALRVAGKFTLRFWLELNRWLRSFDNEVGIPTATAVHKSWKYVSYAMSQSLVRDGDKKRMHRMFLAYRLAPGDIVSPSEISLYLDEWLSHPNSPSWLRRLWANSDLREKVAHSASEELEVWEGFVSVDAEAVHRAAKSSWVAVRKTFPRKKLEFYLTINESNFEEGSSLVLKLDAAGFDVGLQQLNGTEENFIWLPQAVSLKALFGQHFEICDKNSDSKVVCQARPVIALCKVDDANYFKEVSRARSHRNHLVLCHATWRDRVEKHLRAYANSMMSCSEVDQWSGVPSDWVCFSDVVFDRPMDASEVNDDQIQLLVPFAELPSVQPIGGVKLSHGIWHADAPPSMLIPPVIKKTQTVTVRREASNGEDVSYEESYSDFSGDILSRVPFALDGDFNISAGEAVRDFNVGFRTADHAKRKLVRPPKRLFWAIDDPISLVTPSYEEPSGTYCEGLRLNQKLLKADGILPVWSELNKNKIVEYSEHHYDPNVDGGSYIAAECILRGYHYWICEPCMGPETVNSRLVVCKDCGSRIVLPKPKRARFKRNGPNVTVRKVKHYLSPEIYLGKPRIDTVVDALCYRGEGAWEQLKGLLSSVSDTPEEVAEYARRLSDLGVFDLQRDLQSGSIISWVVPPPVIVFQSSLSQLMLTGFRCAGLLNCVNVQLGDVGTYSPVALSQGAVTMHFWKVNIEELPTISEKLSSVKDPLGRAISVVSDPSTSILSNCANFSDLELLLPDYHLDSNTEKERFDLMSGKWNVVEDVGSLSLKEGAYRVRSRGNMYFYRNGEGIVKRGSFDLVKILAARNAGLALHTYDPDFSIFRCLLGVDLPPLLSRCLVISSGELPIIDGGWIEYKNVPQRLASAVLAILYN